MKTYQAVLLCVLCLMLLAVTQLQKRTLERERAVRVSLIQLIQAQSKRHNVAIHRDKISGDVYVKSDKWIYRFPRICPTKET